MSTFEPQSIQKKTLTACLFVGPCILFKEPLFFSVYMYFENHIFYFKSKNEAKISHYSG